MIFGRSESMGSVSRELLRKRIVTIAGPAGIGKTSFAITTAATLFDSFGDAVLFVDLAPIEDPSLVISALASTLGLVLREDDPFAAIVDFLGDERVLIVFDNATRHRRRGGTGRPHPSGNRRPTYSSRAESRWGSRPSTASPGAARMPTYQSRDHRRRSHGYAAVQLFVERATAASRLLAR